MATFRIDPEAKRIHAPHGMSMRDIYSRCKEWMLTPECGATKWMWVGSDAECPELKVRENPGAGRFAVPLWSVRTLIGGWNIVRF